MECTPEQIEENRLILGVIHSTNFLTTLSEAGVTGLIGQMRRYSDVWPQECISELERISGQITGVEARLNSVVESLKEAPPSFDGAYSWRAREYEKHGERLTARLEELQSEIAGLREQRKEILMHSGCYIDARAYFYRNPLQDS